MNINQQSNAGQFNHQEEDTGNIYSSPDEKLPIDIKLDQDGRNLATLAPLNDEQ